MNIWDFLIIAVVLALIFLAFRLAKGRRKKGGCGCGCEGCTKECDGRKK